MAKATVKRKARSPLLSVIIPAKNEERTIARVVRQARKIIARTEVIVVCNGSTDRTAKAARKAGAKVIPIEKSLGWDVGRAVGARHARGKVLLFIDSDFVIPAAALRKYYRTIRRGYDVALNAYSGYTSKAAMHPTSEAKRLLNRLAGRPDLRGSSMTAVPHALSRNAVDKIGCELLAVPPKAQAKAILEGLKITRAPLVRVSRYNPRKPKRMKVKRLIIADHAEAIAYLIKERGLRGGHTDFLRHRELIQDTTAVIRCFEQQPFEPKENSLSVIVTARNEQKTIGKLLDNVKRLDPEEIIVIENGSQDKTLDIIRSHEVNCLSFPFPIGHDVGRMIGAREAKGDILLFLDGDMVLTPKQMRRFVKACEKGADVALNDINPFYSASRMIDYVSMAKHFLNIIARTSKLKYASLTAVPHAMRRSAVEAIGCENLAIPPKAQVIAAANGLKIHLVKGINVIRANKRRWYNRRGRNHVADMILGDHVEALQWLQERRGERVQFHDTERRRELIPIL